MEVEVVGEKKYKGWDAVICTVPLGVLKAGATNLSPHCPVESERYTASWFGTLMKVMIEFSYVFWDSIDFIGFTPKIRGRFPIFVDRSRIYDRPLLTDVYWLRPRSWRANQISTS